ncbi:MAG: hypothetical protein HUJ68_07530 [Clostridia bacterium]|nr:hypothetical protein [Clostridia bacterium]
MNSQEEALLVEFLGKLIAKVTQLKNENKQLKSQLESLLSSTKAEEKKVHKSVSTNAEEPPKRYIFGKATSTTIKEFKSFIEKCISNEGKFEMGPEKVAVWLGISTRARDTYLNSLKSHKIDDKPIITEINGQYYSNFSRETIFEEFFKVLD